MRTRRAPSLICASYIDIYSYKALWEVAKRAKTVELRLIQAFLGKIEVRNCSCEELSMGRDSLGPSPTRRGGVGV